jgi:hypothetical protein
MYQGLFFHQRGGIAMVEHFQGQRLEEKRGLDTKVDKEGSI